MAHVAWISGHIRCFSSEEREAVMKRIELLPDKPYESSFSMA